MTRYLEIAKAVSDLIASGALRVGDSIPSVRRASAQNRVSKGTIIQAYCILEARGLVEARPQSGYYVRARRSDSNRLPRTDLARPKLVEISEQRLTQSILGDLGGSAATFLGSSFPSSTLFPMELLGRAMAATIRRNTHTDKMADMEVGLPELRRAISHRYLELGYSLPMEEIVVTCGATEAISLSLRAVTNPGDVVLVDSPMFFSGLQSLNCLGLRSVEMPALPGQGLDLGLLDETFKRHKVKACLLMTNCQNPAGFTMEESKKKSLVKILQKHAIPLIENDVYAELQFGFKPSRACKAFDESGLVMHCGSFTKCLAPGYKVGWVASGRFRDQILNRKFASTLGTSLPPQKAIAHYLEFQSYDRHLRQLRSRLSQQVAAMSLAIEKYFPRGTLISRPSGGYVLWVQLPEEVDSLSLFHLAASRDVGIAPGPILSASGGYRNFIRMNCGHPWSPSTEKTVKWLGETVSSMS